MEIQYTIFKFKSLLYQWKEKIFNVDYWISSIEEQVEKIPQNKIQRIESIKEELSGVDSQKTGISEEDKRRDYVKTSIN